MGSNQGLTAYDSEDGRSTFSGAVRIMATDIAAARYVVFDSVSDAVGWLGAPADGTGTRWRLELFVSQLRESVWRTRISGADVGDYRWPSARDCFR